MATVSGLPADSRPRIQLQRSSSTEDLDPSLPGCQLLEEGIPGLFITEDSQQHTSTSWTTSLATWQATQTVTPVTRIVVIDEEHQPTADVAREESAVKVVAAGAKFMPVSMTLAEAEATLYGDDAVRAGADHDGQSRWYALDEKPRCIYFKTNCNEQAVCRQS